MTILSESSLVPGTGTAQTGDDQAEPMTGSGSGTAQGTAQEADPIRERARTCAPPPPAPSLRDGNRSEKAAAPRPPEEQEQGQSATPEASLPAPKSQGRKVDGITFIVELTAREVQHLLGWHNNKCPDCLNAWRTLWDQTRLNPPTDNDRPKNTEGTSATVGPYGAPLIVPWGANATGT